MSRQMGGLIGVGVFGRLSIQNEWPEKGSGTCTVSRQVQRRWPQMEGVGPNKTYQQGVTLDWG